MLRFLKMKIEEREILKSLINSEDLRLNSIGDLTALGKKLFVCTLHTLFDEKLRQNGDEKSRQTTQNTYLFLKLIEVELKF